MDVTTEDAIRELAAHVDEAWNNGDAGKMATYWVDSGLNVSPMGDALEGHRAIQADLTTSLSGFMKGSKHGLRVDRVYTINAETVVADGEATISDVVGPGGTRTEPWVSNFSMICTRQEDGTWRIAQMRAYVFLPKQGATTTTPLSAGPAT